MWENNPTAKRIISQVKKLTHETERLPLPPDSPSLFVASGGFVLESGDLNIPVMAEMLGGTNIAKQASGRLKYSFEQLLIDDPDVIFINTMGDSKALQEKFTRDLIRRPAWGELKAAEDGQGALSAPGTLPLYGGKPLSGGVPPSGTAASPRKGVFPMNYEILRRTAGYRLAILAILALLLAAALLAGLRFGSLRLDAAEILHTLLSEREGVKFQILWNIRLPRVLLGALVGGSLAVSGAVLQGIMRNPLASPGIIGISSGGGLGGVLVLLALPQFSHLLVPAAFAGALTTAFLVYLLAWKRGIDPVRLILSGVAVGSMLGAMSSTILLFNAEKVAGILDYYTYIYSPWPQFRLVWPYMLSGFLVSWLASSRLNILMLGDEVAAGLGIRVERVRILLLVAAARCWRRRR